MTGKREVSPRRSISRRMFLGAAACAAGTSVLVRGDGPDDNNEGLELEVPPGVAPSRVVQATARDLVVGHKVHPTLLREMLQRLLTTITGERTEEAAWKAILKRDDIIGLKFNRSGQEVIGTSEVMADTIVTSILESGWRPDQVVCIEAPEAVERRYGTTKAQAGYATDATAFSSGSDQLATVLDQVTAIVDIPFLKTHNIAGLTCALKNLSHGFVRHPARFHGNGCSPFIADIVALPKIRGKLRLCVVDAMRVVFAGGPAAKSSAIADAGTLLASFDPVAVDTVGLELLNETRRRNGLRRIARSPAEVPQLRTAHESGVGMAAPRGIELINLNP